MGSKRRFRNSVGPQIRKQRMRNELSQCQLAAKLQIAGLSVERAGVAKIEAGIRSVFDYELAIIAQILGVKADELFPERNELKELLPALQKGELPLRKKKYFSASAEGGTK